MHLYDDIGDASSSLRGSRSSLIKLSIKHQSYPKSTKIDTFGQKKYAFVTVLVITINSYYSKIMLNNHKYLALHSFQSYRTLQFFGIHKPENFVSLFCSHLAPQLIMHPRPPGRHIGIDG